jgi:hypothetical protein
MNHILLLNTLGEAYIVCRSQIKRVAPSGDGCIVLFTGDKNTPITMSIRVEDFYNRYCTKAHMIIHSADRGDYIYMKEN